MIRALIVWLRVTLGLPASRRCMLCREEMVFDRAIPVCGRCLSERV